MEQYLGDSLSICELTCFICGNYLNNRNTDFFCYDCASENNDTIMPDRPTEDGQHSTNPENQPTLTASPPTPSRKAIRDKIYIDRLTESIINLGSECGVQIPKDFKFSKKPSMNNKHLTKNGILTTTKEWIEASNKKETTDNDFLKQYELENNELKHKNAELQREMAELLQQKLELEGGDRN